MNPGYVEEEITGIPTFEPSFHLPAIWITETRGRGAESLGYTVVDPPSIIATHLTEVIQEPYCGAFDKAGCTESGQQSEREQSGSCGRTHTKIAWSW